MNRYLTLLVTLAFSLSVQANEEWLTRSLKILEESSQSSPDEFLAVPDEDQMEIARAITQEAQNAAIENISLPQQEAESEIPNNGAFLFASFSMPMESIRHMFENEANQPGVQVVFRGMIEGKNLSATYKTIKNLIRDINPQPNIVIDPTLFTEFNITVVPTMIAFVEGEHKATARGITSTKWMFKQLKNEKEGDLGKYGNTYEIAEKDLIEEMKSRYANIDFESMKQKAMDTYWDKFKFLEITPAKKSAIFELDPTIRVSKDITTPDGQYIARAGDEINPLEKVPFTKTLIIFNPTRKNEILFVQELHDAAIKEGRGLVLIATEVDRVKGWDSLNETQAHFDFPVYMLNEQLKERFRIRHTPTTVHADHLRFIITETYVKSL